MGSFSPQGAARAAVANWKPSSSESTRSSTTAEKGVPACAACAQSACASFAEPVVRAERPTSCAMTARRREALCSSSTMRTVNGMLRPIPPPWHARLASTYLQVAREDGAERAGLAEKVQSPQRARGQAGRQRRRNAGEIAQLDLPGGLVLDLDVRCARAPLPPGDGLVEPAA